MRDATEHPAVVRLRRALDAAWKGVGALGELDLQQRDRVVAELGSEVPDTASRAARAVGADAAVAEIRRFAGTDVAGGGDVPVHRIWGVIVARAAEAATAVR